MGVQTIFQTLPTFNFSNVFISEFDKYITYLAWMLWLKRESNVLETMPVIRHRYIAACHNAYSKFSPIKISSSFKVILVVFRLNIFFSFECKLHISSGYALFSDLLCGSIILFSWSAYFLNLLRRVSFQMFLHSFSSILFYYQSDLSNQNAFYFS